MITCPNNHDPENYRTDEWTKPAYWCVICKEEEAESNMKFELTKKYSMEEAEDFDKFVNAYFCKPTLHDQQTAYDEFRKQTAVECTECKGTTKIETTGWVFMSGYLDNESDIHTVSLHINGKPVNTPNVVEYHLEDCSKCNGEAQLCSFCHCNSTQCECGE